MKHALYLIAINIWKIVPFKKNLFYLFNLLPVNFNKYSQDLWFVGKIKVAYLDTYFFLYSTKYDKGTQEIFLKGLKNSWDACSIEVWGKLARKASVVFDIGANMGLYSIAAKAVNPECTVYAFEPSYFGLKQLKKNIEVNKFDIKVAEIALSNYSGVAPFYDSEKSSAASTLNPVDEIKNNMTIKRREIKIQPLSEFVRVGNIEKIDLISIDVELNEPEVLDGMGDLIEKHKPDFIIEVLNNEIGKKIEHFFINRNYLFYSIDEHQMTLHFKKHLNRESDAPFNSFNFLICKEETARYLELLPLNNE